MKITKIHITQVEKMWEFGIEGDGIVDGARLEIANDGFSTRLAINEKDGVWRARTFAFMCESLIGKKATLKIISSNGESSEGYEVEKESWPK